LVGLLCSIERCFELGGWDVVEVAVEACRVVPVDPAEGGQFNVVDGAPRALLGASDQLGLVVAVDRLSQRVVIGIIRPIADGADRWLRAELGESLTKTGSTRERGDGWF
jgi:hypothetical protein